MNLAPFRYRNVLSRHGGPIRATECAMTTVMGHRVFQANAYLADGLRPVPLSNVLFGNPDGSGTALRPVVARYKAISEALERWAHHVTFYSEERQRYGFDVDPSSNGMAAFPGLFGGGARRRAWGEAAERFAVIGWWDGANDAVPVASPWPEVGAWQLENPVSSHAIVLLHALADDGVHAYGHGAGEDFRQACMQAAVELARSQFVLRRHLRRRQTESAPEVRSMLERRCLYFSTSEGYAAVAERLARRKWRSAEPRVVFDGEIVGPWTDYTCVWRVVLAPPTSAFLDGGRMFFYW
jgi:hypothetical protein